MMSLKYMKLNWCKLFPGCVKLTHSMSLKMLGLQGTLFSKMLRTILNKNSRNISTAIVLELVCFCLHTSALVILNYTEIARRAFGYTAHVQAQTLNGRCYLTNVCVFLQQQFGLIALAILKCSQNNTALVSTSFPLQEDRGEVLTGSSNTYISLFPREIVQPLKSKKARRHSFKTLLCSPSMISFFMYKGGDRLPQHKHSEE